MFSPERLISLALRWLVLALAVWVAAELIDGIHLEGTKSTLLVALILGLLNLYVRPVLAILTLPLTIISLGFFAILLNAIMLGLTSWIAGKVESINFHVDDVLAAILGAVIISLVSMVVGLFIRPDRLARELTGRRW